MWSLGAAPVVCANADTSLQRISPTSLFLSQTRNGIRVEATIEVVDGESVEVTRVKLVNLERRARNLRVASYREWVDEREAASSGAIPPTTPSMSARGSCASRRRSSRRTGCSSRGGHLSPEIAFHAAGPGPTGDVALVSYEDTKARFLGLATAGAPDQLRPGARGRDPADDGLLYRLRTLRIAAIRCPHRAGKHDGDRLRRRLGVLLRGGGRGAGAPSRSAGCRSRGRSAASARCGAGSSSPPSTGEQRFAFAADGRSLTVAPCTPRPYAHVLANAFGQGAVLTADGDIFSFFANARQNSLTPFRMGEGRAGPSGQAIYVLDMASREPDCATWLPLRRTDARYHVKFEPGVVTYASRRGDLELEQTVFVPPGRSVEVKILRLRNHGPQDRLYSVAPIFEMVLDEAPSDSRGMIVAERDPSGRALYFRNPRNDFVKGWAFVTTSFAAEFAETVAQPLLRRSHARIGRCPISSSTAIPTCRCRRSGSVAAFCGTVEVRAGGETSRQRVARTDRHARGGGPFRRRRLRSSDWAEQMLAETRRYWDDMLGRLRIETNRPEFDRLVNDWLPYQLLAARLWGRTGPTQRSGATGYRDQLQDVLPLVFIAPELTRRQILLHAGRQFVEGDAVKWWHTAPGGGTGLADRTHASDPHLWLPYVTLRYVEATGDEAVLDVDVPFIEADPVPRGQEGRATVPLPSRESAPLHRSLLARDRMDARPFRRSTACR